MPHPDQLSFPGMSAPETVDPTDRLFLAVFPDPHTAQQIAELAAQLRNKHHLRGRQQDTSRLHVTLHHLGDFVGLPHDIAQSASEVCTAIAPTIAPFDIEFSQAGSFTGKRRNLPFVLKMKTPQASQSLKELQQKLGNALALRKLGFDPAQRFNPHVTLLYDDQNIADFPVPPITWTVSEVVLIHSLLGKTTHIPLGRWPLQA